MRYHYIRNSVFAILILLQILLASLAIRVTDDARKGITTISETLQYRLYALNRMDRMLNHAYHLYIMDLTRQNLRPKDIIRQWERASSRVKISMEQSSDPEFKEVLGVIDRNLASIHDGLLALPLTKSGSHDGGEATWKAMSEIRIVLKELLMAGTPGSVSEDTHRHLPDIFHEIDTLEHYMMSVIKKDRLRAEDIRNVLKDVRANLASLSDGHTTGIEVNHLMNSINTLDSILSEVYNSWRRGFKHSMSDTSVNTLDRLWEQVILSMSELISREEEKISDKAFTIRNRTASERRLFFLLTGLSVLIGLLCILVVSRILTQRLSELTGGTERIAGGDLDFRFSVKTDDELGKLAKSFNRMSVSLAFKENELRTSLLQLQEKDEALKETNLELENRVSERTEALTSVNAELKLMGEVFEHSLEGIFIIDPHEIIIKVNPAFSDITGYSPDEVIGRESWILDSGHHDHKFYDAMKKKLAETEEWEGEVWCRRKNNEPFPAWFSISRMTDGNGHVTGFICLFHDISDIKKQEEMIRHQALHDALTGLPNRLLLADRIEFAIAAARRSGKKLAVLFMDLDNFKKINDSLGHAYGDALLQELSKKLQTFFRADDTVCRMGGDEFVALLVNLETVNVVMELADRILKMLSEPLRVKGHTLYISGSVGVSMYPEDGDDSESLIKNADIAMYRAKNQGKNNVQLFTESMTEHIAERLVLEDEIRHGMASGEFTVFFQPKVDLTTGTITGLEALARWSPAHREPIGPNVFIPVCEDAGLIIELGKIILEAACREGKAIIDRTGNSRMHIAVNLSIKQLMHTSIVRDIKDILHRTGLSPSQLEFEITETAIMTDVEKSVSTLNELSRMGIAISIDDFGTGYSSLYYLKTFPIRTLKIDRRFIRDIIREPDDEMIVETVIAMAKKLRLTIVAEGVEEKEQIELLKTKGCDMVQGFYFSKPIPAEDIIGYIRSFDREGAVFGKTNPELTIVR